MSGATPDFLCLTGPTTSGKTDLSIRVAERMSAEIVSMDSRQVYRGMDIGTDKVSLPDRSRVRHHLLDVVDPDEPYSAGHFARDARRRIREIRSRGRVALLVGGTGFFLRALTHPMFREPPLDPDRRRRLRDLMDDVELEKLVRWARVLDPQRAPVAEAGGRQRVSRLLEIALLSGRPLSWWHRWGRSEDAPLRACVVVLCVERSVLDDRIDARVGRMVERGFIDEVRILLDAGYEPSDPGMSGTGYREVAAHLRGESTLDEALGDMKRQTRQYARRQLTWFRNQLDPNAIRLDGTMSGEEQVGRVANAWATATGEDS